MPTPNTSTRLNETKEALKEALKKESYNGK